MSRRLRALFLTILFLGGGTSLPGLDVLLFHRRGESSQVSTHIESANGCASHIGHCVIGCPASASGALATTAFRLLLDTAAPPVSPQSFAPIPLFDAKGIGFRSRAPPDLA